MVTATTRESAKATKITTTKRDNLLLGSYDNTIYGPLFAVSDEGSAAGEVVRAAYMSAKAQALWPIDQLSLGVALDGERMTSAGEVPIGPEEYQLLKQAASDRLPLTTNVGVRMHTRFTHQLPEFSLNEFFGNEQSLVDQIAAVFDRFVHTIDGRPRPLTVRLSLNSDLGGSESLEVVIEKLEAARQEGKLGPSNLHRISLLIIFEDEISSEKHIDSIEKVIGLAQKYHISEVAIDGELQRAARERKSVQSLLNIIQTEQLQRLLKTAKSKGIRLQYRYQLDVESAARTIWTGLHTARVEGFTAGKFGLIPLTLEEQAKTIELILRWTKGWTAIPAFYVDTPLLTESEVYDVAECEAAAKVWLRVARGAGATLVLFDCPDRVLKKPRKLLKETEKVDDVGVLSIDAIKRIKEFADTLGVSILWSGGITSRQAFDLAKLKVFGIFSTSSTASKIPVTAQFEGDPYLAIESEPTEFGIHRMHSIIQAGFLITSLSGIDEKLVKSIETSANALFEVEQDISKAATELSKLDDFLIHGWKELRAVNKESIILPPLAQKVVEPVPANSVRVFRGRKQSYLNRSNFIDKLGSIFMPMTVQMQRLYGLTAYLPAVPPESDDKSMPDELALVFYSTQGCYHESKRCVGGRAYGEMHDLVFDMNESKSGFPELFDSTIEFDKPYFLFETSVDWQVGYSRLTIAGRRPETAPESFKTAVADFAKYFQSEPKGLDAIILCVQKDWIAWWEHSDEPIEFDANFSKFADVKLCKSSRTMRTQTDLTTAFGGISIDKKSDFINFQFSRI